MYVINRRLLFFIYPTSIITLVEIHEFIISKYYFKIVTSVKMSESFSAEKKSLKERIKESLNNLPSLEHQLKKLRHLKEKEK